MTIEWKWWNGKAVQDETRDEWAARAVDELTEDGAPGDYHFTQSGDSMVVGFLRDGSDGEGPRIEIQDVVVRREATVEVSADRLAEAIAREKKREAAPDLYAALEALHDTAAREAKEAKSISGDMGARIDDARAALRKARGES